MSEVESAAKDLLRHNREGERAEEIGVAIGPATDFCKHAQRVLHDTWPDRCVFKTQLLSNLSVR